MKKSMLAMAICMLSLFVMKGIAYAGISDTLNIKHDNSNVLMADKGSRVASPENENAVGKATIEESITWIVNVPKTADYSVGVQYIREMFYHHHGPSPYYEPEPYCSVEIEANGKVLASRLQPLTKYNEAFRVRGTRQWMDGLIPLKKGTNKITLHLSKLSESQIQMERQKSGSEDLYSKAPLPIEINDIFLVRPDVWQSMKLRAQELKPDLSWMKGKYGLFIHWCGGVYPLYGDKKARETYESGVNTFEVDAFADMVEETGASWVIFTTNHGTPMFPAPIKMLNDILPGSTTSRDLIADLAEALNKRDIKLLLYYGVGSTFYVDRNDNPEKWCQFVIDFVREVSLRYGNSIAGWGYFDGTHPAYPLNLDWETFYRACKAGNPDAVVGISNHWRAQYSPFNDLQTSDCGRFLAEPLDKRLFEEGERYEGLQEHATFIFDGFWFPREPYNGIIRESREFEGGPERFTEEEYIAFFKAMADANASVSVNLMITQDVTSKQPFVNPKSLELMRKIKKELGK